MKYKCLYISLLFIFFIAMKNQGKCQILNVDADSLIMNIDKYNNKKVVVEGSVVHICGVDGKKMKLLTAKGSIIKIVPQDTAVCFDKSFYKKKVKIMGIVIESRIDKLSIDKLESNKTLLCHIDNTPCKDTAWVNHQLRTGKSDQLSKKDIEQLRNTMEITKQNYVSVITIFSEKTEVIEDKK